MKLQRYLILQLNASKVIAAKLHCLKTHSATDNMNLSHDGLCTITA